jgi:hypothetical protein
MFYGGISAETQPFFVANLVIFSHAFHTLYRALHEWIREGSVGFLTDPRTSKSAQK